MPEKLFQDSTFDSLELYYRESKSRPAEMRRRDVKASFALNRYYAPRPSANDAPCVAMNSDAQLDETWIAGTMHLLPRQPSDLVMHPQVHGEVCGSKPEMKAQAQQRKSLMSDDGYLTKLLGCSLTLLSSRGPKAGTSRIH